MADGLDIIIITGLSGSGRSFAIRALEDNGFFCVDNLPAPLIPKFIDLCQGYQEEIRRIGLGVDLRGGQFLRALPQVLADVRAVGHQIRVLFFDASDDVLLRRFSETRRPHPLASEGSIQDGISRERKAVAPIRALADKVIDTSDFNVHQLKREMEQQFCQTPSARRMALFFTSFGYKFGVPHDADMVLDVRFLPNPYFVNELRELSGLDASVRNYLLGDAETGAFLERLYALLEFALPLYEREGKSSLTLALGCTGGRHRSVVLVEELKRRFGGGDFWVHAKHRDVDK
jgi:RNase adapter protein RapZ